MRMTPTRVVAPITAAVAAAIAAVQLRDGIVPMLDTVTYWSGARATADGHPFTTTLAPSFTNVDQVDFLRRGGRIPFVDFPVGWSTLSGTVGAVVGVENAMVALTVLVVAVVGALVVVGTRPVETWTGASVRALAAIGIVTLSAFRLTTQGVLSEPLFCALVLGFVVALARHRDDRCPWWVVAVLGACLGLVRFVGAPLVVLAGLERYRRDRRLLPAVGWTVGLMVPTIVNMVWSSASGGGHSAGWRGLDPLDVRWFARSIGGWVEAGQGDLRYTYFAGAATAWWAWPLAVVVIGGSVTAATGLAWSVFRQRSGLVPAAMEHPAAAAALLMAGLVLGMLGFDALVAPDNRLMLPAGVLVVSGAVWWATEHVDRHPVRSWQTVVIGGLVVLWVVSAARPWNLGDLYANRGEEAAYVRAARASGASVVIVNDADGTHWATEIPAAYSPLPTKALTGEPVDIDGVYRSLPCPMLEANGVLVLADDALFGAGGSPVLPELVAAGRLVAEPFDGGVVYRPSSTACS